MVELQFLDAGAVLVTVDGADLVGVVTLELRVQWHLPLDQRLRRLHINGGIPVVIPNVRDAIVIDLR